MVEVELDGNGDARMICSPGSRSRARAARTERASDGPRRMLVRPYLLEPCFGV